MRKWGRRGQILPQGGNMSGDGVLGNAMRGSVVKGGIWGMLISTRSEALGVKTWRERLASCLMLSASINRK